MVQRQVRKSGAVRSRAAAHLGSVRPDRGVQDPRSAASGYQPGDGQGRTGRRAAGVTASPADRLDSFLQRREITQIALNIYGPVIVGDKNIVTTGANSPVATGGSAVATGSGTAAAGESAAASGGSAAAAGGSQARVGFVERAKKSKWTKAWGGIALLLTIATTVLVLTHAFRFDWAGYILAVIGIVVAVVPLFGG
jgi:hypothetical protein